MRIHGRWLGAVIGIVAIGLGAAPLASADDPDAGPAMATSEDSDQMEAGSESPDSLDTGSEDSDRLLTGSGSPNRDLAGSEDSDALEGHAEDSDAELGRSYDEGNLPMAGPDPATSGAEAGATPAAPGPVPQEVRTFAPGEETGAAEGEGGPAGWEGKLAQARAQLDRAQRDLEHWTDAYTRSITEDEPRGEARAKIIDSRNQAQSDVEAARRELAATAESARRAGVNPMVIEGFTGSN